VTLTVTDGSGQTNSVTKSVQVPASTTNHAPTASISSPVSATFVQGASISFIGAGSDQEDGEGSQVEDDQPAQRAGEQGTYLQPRAAIEEVGEPAAHRPLLRPGA
jgi:hypothetical protein